MKRIFISSTFIDMPHERDLFHSAILPAVNKIAKEYGEEVSVCDLRWGVNTNELDSEESSKKVLSVCLDEIDRCDRTEGTPYFIVLIGDRYGWAPESRLVQSAAARKNFSVGDRAQSVTELEISYGALRDRNHLERTLFYFREFNNDVPQDSRYAVDGDNETERALNRTRLNRLKTEIIKQAKDRVKQYRVTLCENESLEGLDSFVEMVTTDILRLMEKDWANYREMSPHEKLSRAQWNIAMQKASQFGAREGELAGLLNSVCTRDGLTVLRGASGSGKSTLMSRAAFSLKETGADVIPIFCGSATELNDAMDVLQHIVYELEERKSLPHFSYTSKEEDGGSDDLVSLWRERLNELTAGGFARRTVIMIDAVDQLFADELRERCVFLPTQISGNLSVVFSCLDEDRHYLTVQQTPNEIVLQDMTKAETLSCVRSILRYLGRELEECVIVAISEKPEAANPLYLSLLLQRLVMMDKESFDEIASLGNDNEARENYKLKMILNMSNTVENACYDVLDEACKRIKNESLSVAMTYLALSQNGLRESDLAEIMNERGYSWNSLDFALLCNYLSGFFLMRDDGRIDFTHKAIRAGFKQRCTNAQDMHAHILDHLDTLDWDDVLSLDETVYQCYYANDVEYFIWYIEELAKDDYEIGLTPAAKKLYDCLNLHGVGWLLSIIKDKNTVLGYEFFDFVFNNLGPHFHYTGEKYRVLIGLLQEAAIRYARSLETAEDRDRVLLASMHNEIGDCFETLTESSLAEKHYLQTIRILEPLSEKGIDEVSSVLARVYNRYGLLLTNEKRYSEVLPCLKRAAKEWEKLGYYASVAVVYHNMANYHFYRSEWEEELFYEKKALATLEKVDWEENCVADMILYNRRIALCYDSLDRKKEGVPYAERALFLAKHYTAIDPQTYEEELGYAYNDYALFLSGEEYDPAVVNYYEKAAEIIEKYAKILPEEHEETLATVYCNIGMQYVQNTDTYKQAEEAYVKSVLIRERLYVSHPEAFGYTLANTYNELGLLCLKSKKNGEAKRYFLLAVRVALKGGIEDLFLKKADLAIFYRNVAYVYRMLWQFSKARRYESYAEEIDACETPEELKAAVQKRRSKLSRSKARDTHPFVRICTVWSGLFWLLFLQMAYWMREGLLEGDLQKITLLGMVLFSYGIGFLAAISISVEVKTTGTQKIILWGSWYATAGLATGWYIRHLRKKVAKARVCGFYLKEEAKGKIRDAQMEITHLAKKIAQLEKKNEQLEKRLEFVRDEGFCRKRNRRLFRCILVNGLAIGIAVMMVIASKPIFAICLLLAVLNTPFSFGVVKDVWQLDGVKRKALSVIAVASLGALTGVASLALFYRDFNLKMKRYFAWFVFAFYTPSITQASWPLYAVIWAVILVVWLIRRKKPKFVKSHIQYPIEVKIARNTDKLNEYRMRMMQLDSN